MKITARLWLGIAVLIVLSPLGLILPRYFKSTGAWLEAKSPGAWKAPFADYGFKGWEEKGLIHSSAAYIVSGIAGIGLIIIAVWLIGKILAKKKD